MTVYYRLISSVLLKIYVSDRLGAKLLSEIEPILKTFSQKEPQREGVIKECTALIGTENDSQEINATRIVIQEDRPSWMFELIQQLEDFMTNALNCTTFHGTCITVDHECLAILGSRMSGKTTLTKTLLEYYEGNLITDDAIFLIDNSVFGLGTPLLMRNYNPVQGDAILTTSDGEGRIRKLCPGNVIHVPVSLPSYLLFPHFDATSEPQICRLNPGTLFLELMSNVRHHKTIKELRQDVLVLKDKPAYSITYPSQEVALKLLATVLPFTKGI